MHFEKPNLTNAKEISDFLVTLKKNLFLREKYLFSINEYHINLSIDKAVSVDSIPFMQYNCKKKEITGVNPLLREKLIKFCHQTENQPFIQQIKNHL